MLQCLITVCGLALIFAAVWFIANKIITHFGFPDFVTWCIGAIMGLVLLVKFLPCIGVAVP